MSHDKTIIFIKITKQWNITKTRTRIYNLQIIYNQCNLYDFYMLWILLVIQLKLKAENIKYIYTLHMAFLLKSCSGFNLPKSKG